MTLMGVPESAVSLYHAHVGPYYTVLGLVKYRCSTVEIKNVTIPLTNASAVQHISYDTLNPLKNDVHALCDCASLNLIPFSDAEPHPFDCCILGQFDEVRAFDVEDFLEGFCRSIHGLENSQTNSPPHLRRVFISPPTVGCRWASHWQQLFTPIVWPVHPTQSQLGGAGVGHTSETDCHQCLQCEVDHVASTYRSMLTVIKSSTFGPPRALLSSPNTPTIA